MVDQKEQLVRIKDAIDMLLNQHEILKKSIYEKIHTDLMQNVFPFLEKLRTERMSLNAKTYLAIIEENIKKSIQLSLPAKCSSLNDFSPSEIQIIELIKQGKRSKEIAQLLNLSTATVSFHRNHIRKKLGISNKNIRLYNYLVSIGIVTETIN